MSTVTLVSVKNELEAESMREKSFKAFAAAQMRHKEMACSIASRRSLVPSLSAYS